MYNGSAMATERKEKRLDLRATARQVELLQRAAEAAGRSVTDFVVSAAVDRAEDVLTDQRLFVIDAESWNRFNAAIESPAGPVPQLVELFGREANSGREAVRTR